MRVLVFGKTGQLARELARHSGVICLDRTVADLQNLAVCKDAILSGDWDGVINAAAYTDVGGAEQNEAVARVINGDAPTAMAQAAAQMGLPFVHISSDYVFNGSGNAPWHPDDAPKPINAYGRSKLLGERGVQGAAGKYAIIRTSWIFSAHGSNFVKTMLSLGAGHDQLDVVSDQIGGPTPAGALAEACLRVLAGLTRETAGTYHFSGQADTNWADFARQIFRAADMSVKVNDISAAEYAMQVARPANSRLNCDKINQVFAIDRPDWTTALQGIVKDIIA